MPAQPPPLPPIDYRASRPFQPGDPSKTVFDRVAGLILGIVRFIRPRR